MGLVFSSLLRAIVIVGWLTALVTIEDAYFCGGEPAACADIGGIGILALITVAVAAVAGYWDGRRLRHPFLVWIIATVVGTAGAAWVWARSSDTIDPLGASIVLGVLIAAPALFFAFLGRSVRKEREALGSSL